MTTARLFGPMFAPPKDDYWESSFDKMGAHYNIYEVHGDAMAALRMLFPEGAANKMNLCLFSTSGVHGSYSTIEEAEMLLMSGRKNDDGTDRIPEVTFLVIQPRLVCLRYGNCYPKTADDIAFLKALRYSTWTSITKIGQFEVT